MVKTRETDFLGFCKFFPSVLLRKLGRKLIFGLIYFDLNLIVVDFSLFYSNPNIILVHRKWKEACTWSAQGWYRKTAAPCSRACTQRACGRKRYSPNAGHNGRWFPGKSQRQQWPNRAPSFIAWIAQSYVYKPVWKRRNASCQVRITRRLVIIVAYPFPRTKLVVFNQQRGIRCWRAELLK